MCVNIHYQFTKVNDLFQEITDREIFMYADDTLLSNTGDMLNQCVMKCQTILDKMMSWCTMP